MNLIELLVKNTQHRVVNGGVAIAQTTLTAQEYEATVAELLELGYPPYTPPTPEEVAAAKAAAKPASPAPFDGTGIVVTEASAQGVLL